MVRVVFNGRARELEGCGGEHCPLGAFVSKAGILLDGAPSFEAACAL